MLALLALVQDCPSQKQTNQAGSGVAQMQPSQPHYQRFVPFPAHVPKSNVIEMVRDENRDWALDTKTGQVCRTWDWSLEGQKASKNGTLPVQMVAPTCLDLYVRYPDSAAPRVRLIASIPRPAKSNPSRPKGHAILRADNGGRPPLRPTTRLLPSLSEVFGRGNREGSTA